MAVYIYLPSVGKKEKLVCAVFQKCRPHIKQVTHEAYLLSVTVVWVSDDTRVKHSLHV